MRGPCPSFRPNRFAAWMLLAVVMVFRNGSAMGEDDGGGVLLIDVERLSVLAGGEVEYPRIAELELRTVPPDIEAEVSLKLRGGKAAEGRLTPPVLSSGRVVLKGGRPAVVLLVSGDVAGPIEVVARWREGEVSKRIEVCSRWSAEPLVVAPVREPLMEVSPELVRRAEKAAGELADPREAVREAARRTLLSLGRASVGPLLKVISDPAAAWGVRKLAVGTLSGIRDESAIDSLLMALRHPSAFVRYAAVSGLKGRKGDTVRTAVSMAMREPDPRVRSAAVEVAVDLPGLRSEAFRLLEDPDPMVRGRTAWVFAASGDPELQEALDSHGVGLFDRETFVRLCALRGLAASGPGKLYAGIVAALAHPEGMVRAQAVLAAASVWDDRLNELVLADRSALVRRALAFAALKTLGRSTAVRFLRRLFDDDDAEARRMARRGLCEKGDFEDLGRFARLLDEVEFRDDAVSALRRVTAMDFGYPEARSEKARGEVLGKWRKWCSRHLGAGRVEVWEEALRMKGSRLRGWAAGLLVSAGKPPSKVLLEALALDKYPENRTGAAAALFRVGWIGKAVEILLEEVRSDRWLERRLAVNTAASLGHPGMFPVLIAALDDPDLSLRREAWEALASLAGERLFFEPNAPARRRQAQIKRIQEWFVQAYPEYHAETW